MRARATETGHPEIPRVGWGTRLRETVALLPQMDWLLLGLALGIGAVGVLFIYSAGYRGPDLPAGEVWKKQVVWLVMGTIGFFILALTDYRWFCRWGWLWYGAAVGVLAFTVGLGMITYGAKRWLSLGPLGTVQPSEFAKLAVLLALAGWLGARGREPKRFRDVLLTLGIMGPPFLLVLKQPDLGSAMVLVPMTFGMLFVARARVRHLLAIVLAGVALLPILYLKLEPYQKKRVTVYVSAFFENKEQAKLLRKEGWNVSQSKIAVGSGGVWGKGWRNNTQSRLSFLPVASKDFIFAVFAEETGFVGSALLLLAYGLLLALGLKTAAEATDRMGALLATGVVAMLGCHIVVNIGMTIGLLPVTGIPLPLMSYGGSFVLVVMLALGLLQSIRLHRRLY